MQHRINMNKLPHEILTSIAAQLPTSTDICRFRLVERRCAAAAFSILFEKVHVLNTIECLQKARTIVQSPHGNLASTRHLTLYHGTWPADLSPHTWRNHPLALPAGNGSTQAFEIYKRFSQEEASRQFDNDVALFHALLGHFPQLRSLRIADLHAQKHGPVRNFHYDVLKDRVRMIPCFQGKIHDILARASCHFHLMQHLTRLSLEGEIDSSAITFRESFPRVLSLSVAGLIVKTELSEHICRFLSAFPSLRQLSVRSASFGPPRERVLPLPAINLASLCHIELHGIGASEHDLLNFVCRHGLQSLSFTDLTLIEGSWESFFTLLRYRLPGIQFHGGGVLAAVHTQTYWLDVFSLRLLRFFFGAPSFPWPFPTSTIG